VRGSQIKASLIALLVLLFSTSQLHSEQRNTAGLPGLPCSKIIEWKGDETMQRIIVNWVFGFWTGWNFAISRNEKQQRDLGDQTVEREALRARILAFCYEQPNEFLMNIAVDFYFKLPELPVGYE
jgi:hypothetical protein